MSKEIDRVNIHYNNNKKLKIDHQTSNSNIQIESSRNVYFIHSSKLSFYASLNPILSMRYNLFISLFSTYIHIKNYRYLSIVDPIVYNDKDILRYLRMNHVEDYINILKLFKLNENKTTQYKEWIEDHDNQLLDKLSEYGLIDDCYPFHGLWEYIVHTSSSTIFSAKLLIPSSKEFENLQKNYQYNENFPLIVMNPYGGFHHAKPQMASGFCYINDIVIALLLLLTHYHHILYIDIDLHHADGIENAFWFSDDVFVVSFHHYAPGFFPGSGRYDMVGKNNGLYHNLNIPLRKGLSDQSFISLFKSVLPKIFETYRPDVVVLQCGVDGLTSDPNNIFNLSSRSYSICLNILINLCQQQNLSLLVLGGGGYHDISFSRAWICLLSIACGYNSIPSIPFHQYYLKYGPDYSIHTQSNSHWQDLNDPPYLCSIMAFVNSFINKQKNLNEKNN